MTDDAKLLRDYAKHGSEAAFGELVARYVDLVYSTALRQVNGDAHLAQDVTQNVFIDLARRAGVLPTDVVLGGWLYRHTGFTASKVVRGEQRRRIREQEAVNMNALHTQPNTDAAWRQVAPVLDEAMQQLGARDRDAIVLRYFERRDLRAVGAALGTNEDAAQKRISRALEKLRAFLARRGITFSAAVLATTIASQSVTAAPAGLAISVTGAALAGAAASGGIVLTLLKIMSITKIKAAIVTAVLFVGVAVSIVVQHQTNQKLQEENEVLRAQTAQMAALREENDQLAKLKAVADELERLRKEHNELLRLRGEISVLRRDLKNSPSRSNRVGQSSVDLNAATNVTPVVASFQANVRENVGNGQTLATGGWCTEAGKHMLVLMTPQMNFEGDEQAVCIQTQLIEIPDKALAALGLDAFKVDGNQSSLKVLFSVQKAAEIMKGLKETEGVNFLSAPRVTTKYGVQASVSMTREETISGESHTLGPVINLDPNLSADGTSVDLQVSAEINTLLPSSR